MQPDSKFFPHYDTVSEAEDFYKRIYCKMSNRDLNLTQRIVRLSYLKFIVSMNILACMKDTALPDGTLNAGDNRVETWECRRSEIIHTLKRLGKEYYEYLVHNNQVIPLAAWYIIDDVDD